MDEKPNKRDLETEVLVVGTGGAGLTAAILAHDIGAKVTVIERSNKVGGTTAISGGGLWIPLNHHMAEKGYSDSREDALTYCKILTKGRASDELVEAYVDTASEMLKYMEDNTSVRFEACKMPDYHPSIEGSNAGRTVGPSLFNLKELGEAAVNLRRSPAALLPITFTEIEEWEANTKPHQVPSDLIAERMKAGLVGLGEGLVGQLYKACLDRGIEPILNTRALELVMDGGRVVGMLAEHNGKNWYAKARKAVILACGGFEWNDELKASYLPGPVTYPNTPPFNEGDGLKMSISAGAALGNMCENWGWVSLKVPGEEYEGRPLSRGTLTERALPHGIIVNKHGKRFVNEAANYNNMFKSFWILDPNTCEYANLPAWFIIDQQYRDKYAFGAIMPRDEVPDWVERADTLEELARSVGIDPKGLKDTVERFNRFATEGVDRDFHRGQSIYDHYWGDKDNKPNPCLGPINTPPFSAFPAYCSSIGTKGGPKTNTKGQVLSISGKPIIGLYAAGNVMACVNGPTYWGGGASIGLCMTFGYICGANAARD